MSELLPSDKRVRRKLTPKQRVTLRVVSRDSYAKITEIKEQEIPATAHEIGLFLRRAPFREQIADAMLNGSTITIERRW